MAEYVALIYEGIASIFVEAGAGEVAGAAGAGAWGGAAAADVAGSGYAAAGAASAAGTYGSYALAASSALSGYAQYNSAQNQQKAAEYNAATGRTNAEMAAMQAGANEDAQRRRSNLILGQQRAAFAQSGVDPSSGSGLLVQEQSAQNAELDALNVRYEGLLKGRGMLAQSDLDQRQAGIYGQNAGMALGNTVLSTVGSYYSARGSRGRSGASGY